MSFDFHNKKYLEKRRKELRRNETRGERLLWLYIRNKKIGYKFKRQHSIGPYIADFYCGELHLVVEIDGPMHFEDEKTIEKDKRRAKFLDAYEFTTIRFTWVEVWENVGNVVERIKKECDILKARYQAPSPGQGEGRGEVKRT